MGNDDAGQLALAHARAQPILDQPQWAVLVPLGDCMWPSAGLQAARLKARLFR
jgi:hypothetical protein